MADLHRTQFFKASQDKGIDVKEVLATVCACLQEKGYNPTTQIVGYIMSGDPTYITSHRGARNLIVKVERDELLEVLVNNYIQHLEEKV